LPSIILSIPSVADGISNIVKRFGVFRSSPRKIFFQAVSAYFYLLLLTFTLTPLNLL
jgi:hypothetical protein